MADDVATAAQRLLEPWRGPFGGLPPFDLATPAAIEAAVRIAVDRKRAEVRAIATNPEPPDVVNTIEALEDCGRLLGRILPIHTAFANGRSTGDMPAVARRLAPLVPALDDEIAHDEALFARVDAVFRRRHDAGLSAEQTRLVEVVHARMLRQGAGLAPAAKSRLQAIHGRLAGLSAAFQQNLIADGDRDAVFVADVRRLEGLPEPQRAAAAETATRRGRPGEGAIANDRGSVWAVLGHCTDRDLRERVWRMWTSRGDHAGPTDNKPLMAEILALRGEKAALLGHRTYAHFALADRMVDDPAAIERLLLTTWRSVLGRTRAQVSDYQAIADREGAGITLEPWDRQFYAEKLRRERFGVDGDAIRAHLPLDRVMEAMFAAAERLHGLAFEEISQAPVLAPGCRVFGVTRGGEPVGVLSFDLLARPGKMHGSHQTELRTHETFRGRVLPVSSIHSSFPPPPEGRPVLLPYEYANVFFHEFGHALHMLSSTVSYPSLGPTRVAWDFVELPALLNERWLLDRRTLADFARHHETDAPMPPELVERLERALRHDRVFSLNLDYLLPAIVDLRMHLAADGSGRPIDALRIEEETLRELGMPAAWDLVMRAPHSVHGFVAGYAAGLYVYLWADVMAADVAETFLRAPGGLDDGAVAARWRESILSVGHRVPAGEAFRAFAGRDPDLRALQRRFGLAEAAADSATP